MKNTKQHFIIQDLLSKIYSKKFKEDKLPTQRALATQYEVSRYTIQQCLKQLKQMGIVNMIQGDGIYINKSNLKNTLIYNSMTETPYRDIESKCILLQKIDANQDLANIFNIKYGDSLWEFKRIRIVNFEIKQLEHTYLPCYLFPYLSIDDIEGSIQDFVKSYDLSISHSMKQYRPINLTREQSELFMRKKGFAAMQILNHGILQSGEIFEYSEIIAVNFESVFYVPFDKKHHNDRLNY
ncbi:GntR family transcriptional regulator [Streptococcus merionis]|uniref:GntR family transcriptional regulator n=1 Tax=Streptococcus merionis TaxID=400065 RepID=A0A239SWP0_9STRE|nr:GntR family transcriptional regulator [Streptococcus merionis]SNU89258.1 GntR family transcriptional regulator [Streptococcus merionis]